MESALERELKLEVGDGFALPDLGGEELPARVFVSTYRDTDDHRLLRAGVTLRHRVENGRGRWQLKLPRGAARLELDAGGGPAKPPPQQLRLLPALTRRRALEPVARLRTRREGVRVRDGGSVADVLLDSVAVLEGRRVLQTFEEIEVELVEGDERLLASLGKTLRRAGAKRSDARPKLAQALGVAAGPDPVSSDATVVGALQAIARLQLEALLDHDPGTRLGTDPEDLHQLRVATRRLRAYLRAARPVLERQWADELRAELAWLGGELGPVRDLDVLLDYLRGEAAALDGAERDAFAGLLAKLEAERATAREQLLAALDGDRYLDLLDRIEAAAADPRVLDPDVPLERLWQRDFKRLRRAAGSLGDEPSDDSLHALRIRGKRARYAAELAEPALGKPTSRYLRESKRFQDVLGEHQDAVVAEERIRSLLRGSRSSAAQLGGGRLIERQRARRVAARAAFADAWERLERAGRKAL